MNKQDYAHVYERGLERLISDIENYEQHDDIWTLAPGISNSAGHLAQHLVGNLKTFICTPLGGIPYVRDRDAEFTQRRFSYEQLLEELKAVKVEVVETIAQIPDLDAIYPGGLKIQYDGCSISFMLTYLLDHLAYHGGQVNYHRRLHRHFATLAQK